MRVLALAAVLLPLAGAAQSPAPPTVQVFMVAADQIALIEHALKVRDQKIADQEREIERLKQQCVPGNVGI